MSNLKQDATDIAAGIKKKAKENLILVLSAILITTITATGGIIEAKIKVMLGTSNDSKEKKYSPDKEYLNPEIEYTTIPAKFDPTLCLEVDGFDIASNGHPVGWYACDRLGDDGYWFYDGMNRLHNKANLGLCLDVNVSYSPTTVGSRQLIVWGCHHNQNQAFFFEEGNLINYKRGIKRKVWFDKRVAVMKEHK